MAKKRTDLAVKKVRSEAPTFTSYDRQIINLGGARVLSVGRIVPREWASVRVIVMRMDVDGIVLRIERGTVDGE